MRIGVLTGGGDVPGLNSCIKAIVNRAEENDWQVFGFRRGWAGPLNVNPKDAADRQLWVEPLTLAKFQEVVQLDPTNEQAWKLWEETDKNIWEELFFQDVKEIRKIAQHLMDRAKIARKTMSRDDAAIKALVANACADDYDARVKAVNYGRARR